MRVLVVLALFGVIYLTDVSGGKNNTCDRFGVLLYEELKCKPVNDKDHSCPSQYECPEYKLSPNECNFQGRKIPLGEKATLNSCDHCSCASFSLYNPYSTNAGFACPVIDCYSTWKENCVWIYTPTDCYCPTLKCPPYDDDEQKCKVDGTTYVEGQSFKPKDTCLACVCAKGFEEGNYDNPEICTRINCSFEYTGGHKYARNCAPVYMKDDTSSESLCCPYAWVCPDDSDDDSDVSDIIIPDPTNENKDLKCKYGEKTLNYKDSFTRTIRPYSKFINLTCSCDLPPLMTCKE